MLLTQRAGASLSRVRKRAASALFPRRPLRTRSGLTARLSVRVALGPRRVAFCACASAAAAMAAAAAMSGAVPLWLLWLLASPLLRGAGGSEAVGAAESAGGAGPGERFKIEGRAVVPGVKPQDWIAGARVLVDGEEHVGFLK